jgi:hypothetical protein
MHPFPGKHILWCLIPAWCSWETFYVWDSADYRIAQALAIVGTVEDLWELELDEVEVANSHEEVANSHEEVANSHPQRGGGGTRKPDGGGSERQVNEYVIEYSKWVSTVNELAHEERSTFEEFFDCILIILAKFLVELSAQN